MNSFTKGVGLVIEGSVSVCLEGGNRPCIAIDVLVDSREESSSLAIFGNDKWQCELYLLPPAGRRALSLRGRVKHISLHKPLESVLGDLQKPEGFGGKFFDFVDAVFFGIGA